jgi:hypothetical protein
VRFALDFSAQNLKNHPRRRGFRLDILLLPIIVEQFGFLDFTPGSGSNHPFFRPTPLFSGISGENWERSEHLGAFLVQ